MPKKTLNALFVKNVKPDPTRVIDYSDQEIDSYVAMRRGFLFRVSPRGLKSWVARLKYNDGPKAGYYYEIKIGEWPTMKLASVLLLSALFALPFVATAETAPAAPAESANPDLGFGDYEAVGFLSDYSKISKTANDDGSYEYKNTTVDYGKYNKLLVDRIKVFFKDDSDYKGIDPDELKVLTDYFYEAVNKEVGDAYPMVTEPGPDVLRLRVAVTDLVPNKPEASVATLVIPFSWVADAGSGVVKGDAGSTVFTGHASIEVEALDSDSSEQLVAFIETEPGKKYNWTSGVIKGVKSYTKAYSKWAYTKQAMDSWAHLLRVRLDAAHGATDKK